MLIAASSIERLDSLCCFLVDDVLAPSVTFTLEFRVLVRTNEEDHVELFFRISQQDRNLQQVVLVSIHRQNLLNILLFVPVRVINGTTNLSMQSKNLDDRCID